MYKTIHDVIDDLRSDPAGISSKFGIPLSTVYGWCNGNRTPPVYVIGMMNTIINLERSCEYGKRTNRLGKEMERDTGREPEACEKGKSEAFTT